MEETDMTKKEYQNLAQVVPAAARRGDQQTAQAHVADDAKPV